MALKYIADRLNDYNINLFVSELADAAKYLGILQAKIDTYQFNSILIPMLHKKEVLSSMDIEGTQKTTLSDICEREVDPKRKDEKESVEVRNHTKALIYGADHLRNGNFTHSFIQEIHRIMMTDLEPFNPDKPIGKYKMKNNHIENSVGTVVFTPPPYNETKKYMNELVDFINNGSNIHPLIKSAIIHAQFESIHPFADGNGRVGRILVSLYLYKANVINFPFFYISEAINQDKRVYYNMLTNSRNNSYDEWIKYFLNKIIVQTGKHIGYIDSLNNLYVKTKCTVQKIINSPKFDDVIECLFTHPVLTANYIEDKLNISHGQAVRYLNALEKAGVLFGDDKKRGRNFYFSELLGLAQ